MFEGDTAATKQDVFMGHNPAGRYLLDKKIGGGQGAQVIFCITCARMTDSYLVKAACLEKTLIAGSNPTLAFKFQKSFISAHS